MADGTGAWSFTPKIGRASCSERTATQTDAAGKNETVTLSHMRDSTAPAVSMALAADPGSSSSDNVTFNPAITGFGEANTLVTIKEGGATLGTAMADGTGAWSFTP